MLNVMNISTNWLELLTANNLGMPDTELNAYPVGIGRVTQTDLKKILH